MCLEWLFASVRYIVWWFCWLGVLLFDCLGFFLITLLFEAWMLTCNCINLDMGCLCCVLSLEQPSCTVMVWGAREFVIGMAKLVSCSSELWGMHSKQHLGELAAIEKQEIRDFVLQHNATFLPSCIPLSPRTKRLFILFKICSNSLQDTFYCRNRLLLMDDYMCAPNNFQLQFFSFSWKKKKCLYLVLWFKLFACYIGHSRETGQSWFASAKMFYY